MRASLGLSSVDLARHLGTSPDVIASLEAGYIGALPPWPETERILLAFGRLLDVDVMPILARARAPLPAVLALPEGRHSTIAAAIAGPAATSSNHLAQSPRAVAATPVRPAARLVTGAPRSDIAPSVAGPSAASKGRAALSAAVGGGLTRIRTWRRRAIAAATAALLIVTASVWTVLAGPASLLATVDHLPPGLTRSIRAGLDRLTLRTSAGSDGLKWVEATDPRSRKADRLPVKGQGN